MNYDALIEGKINGISITNESDDHGVVINMVDNDSNVWVLTAATVSDLLVEEIRLQNIIEHISVFDKSSIDCEDARRRIFYLLRGKDPECEGDLAWDGVDKVVSDISNGIGIFLEITPVYGAYILLIAKSISLERA